MPLTIRIEALSLNAAEMEIIRADTQLVFRVLSRLRRRRGIRASRVTAVVADDFAAAVERHYRARPGEKPAPGWYDTERMGGVPVAKTLDQSDDGSDVVIVFDALRWRGAATDVLARVDGIGTTGHEFAHAVLNRARHASGAMNDVVLPSITGHEAARSLARIIGDEYRADRIADEVVAACTHVPEGPSSQGLPWRIATEEHLAAAKNVIESTYPGWPDLVDEYRNYRMPLEEMWSRFGRSFEIALTMLTHVQAHADAAEAGDVLARPEFAALPGVRLYLEPYRRFLDAVRGWPAIVPQRDVRKMEDQLVRAGAECFLEIWRRLGLRPEDKGGRTWALWVEEPVR